MKTIKDTKPDYILVDGAEEREQLITLLLQQKSICFDSETDELDIHLLNAVGISFSYKAGTAHYVPLPEDYKEAQEILREFECVFADTDKEIIGHNLKFDLKVLKKYNIVFKAKIFDTLLADYLLRPDNKKRKMDVLAEEFLNYSPIPIENLIGPRKIGGKKAPQKTMREVPVTDVCEYAAEDADVTFQLKQVFEKMLLAEDLMDLFTNVECKLIPVLVDMEYEGVAVDKKLLGELAVEYKTKAEAVEKEIYTEAGKPFKISSPKQLGKILFDEFSISYDADYTETGDYSTSATVLKKIRTEHPIIEKVLAYRNFKGLQQKATKLPTLVNKNTNRLHTDFNQSIAATGRLSSSHPNLQSLPSRDDEGKLIRKAIIPSAGNVFIVADYSQIELRIMAHVSKDGELINAYNKNADIHAYTASLIFNIPIETVNDSQRTIAKTVNFGLNYGMGAKGLADRLNIQAGTEYDEYDAQEWIDSFFERYSGVAQYMEEQIDFASVNGYTKTMMGRKRYFLEIGCGVGQERNAINFPIQGSAADIMKVAMINIHNRLNKENLKAKMVLTVHDEVVLDTPISEKTIVKNLVKDEMEKAIELCIPLIAEVKMGDNWLDAKSKKEEKTEPATV